MLGRTHGLNDLDSDLYIIYVIGIVSDTAVGRHRAWRMFIRLLIHLLLSLLLSLFFSEIGSDSAPDALFKVDLWRETEIALRIGDVTRPVALGHDVILV